MVSMCALCVIFKFQRLITIICGIRRNAQRTNYMKLMEIMLCKLTALYQLLCFNPIDIERLMLSEFFRLGFHTLYLYISLSHFASHSSVTRHLNMMLDDECNFVCYSISHSVAIY